MTSPILAINGPTASGKSAVAVAVAQQLIEAGQPAEIVNADSMLVYRGMDIGTAKPTLAERGGVTHHLIDLWEVTHSATVAEFQVLARERLLACRAASVIPILVGGSALYVRAILDEFDFPGTDAQLRAQLEADLADVGAEAMHARLRSLDPEAAEGIQPGNGRRIVRALEVVELTGSYRSVLPSGRYALDQVVEVGLELDRAALDLRIEQRVDRMWEQGFVAEVEGLLERGLREGRTAWRALGYRQILDFLDGRISQDEARRATIVGTRRFARKQAGWFRREPRISWVASGSQAAVAVAGILDAARTRVVSPPVGVSAAR